MKRHWYIAGFVLVLVLLVAAVLLGVLLTKDSGDSSDTDASASSSSCAGRCGSPKSGTYTCQCNSVCVTFDDCCSDYTSTCQTSASVCGEMSRFTQDLWTSDADRLSPDALILNYQGQVASKGTIQDNATERLMTFVDETQLNSGVYTTFLALLDNYDPVKNVEENVTSEKLAEEEAFLDAILATPTLTILYDYLLCQGKVQNVPDFRSVLRRLWFDLYARSGSSSALDTSGFEHVMVGEFKSVATVNGMHSWLSFYRLEQSGELNYYGHSCSVQKHLVCAAFNWDGRMKTLASFFLGTSPAYDIAIYSLCYIMYPGRRCSVVVDGESMSIQTYSKEGHIATAFVRA